MNANTLKNNRNSFRKLTTFLIATFSAVFLILPDYAAAACSPYIGQATLNEFFKDQANQSNDPDDFAEVKILNDSILQSTYDNWTIKICERSTAASNNDEDGCSADIKLNTFTDTSKPWLVLKGSVSGQHINLKTGFDATLLDINGDLIDYITVDGYSDAITGIGCNLSNLVFDYTASSPGASDKTIFRSPDGTGVWDSAPSATAPPTEDTTNDTLPSPPAGEAYPYVTINNVSLSTPGTATFTVSLTDATGNPATFSQAVTITYYTQDGTATAADNDYTAVPLATPATITIAAGQTSTTLTVASPLSTDADADEYFYAVLQAVQNSAANGGNPNAIISKHFGTATLNGPVAEWNFDVCTVSSPFDIKDTSGNNLHASPANGITTASGKICSALSLDGANDYAEVADNASLDISQKLTVMAWIRPDTIPGSGLMTILSKDENYEFHINSSGYINWWWNNSSGGTRQFNSTVTIPTNAWTHVAIVYEPGSQRIVINGVVRGTAAYNETLITNNDPLHIGGDQLFAGRYFDGLIDEVKVYRRALSTAEINDYYNNPNPGNRTCPTCSTASCNTFRDEFSSENYNLQAGTVNWSSNWIETGDNNNASSGDIEISSGELQLEGDGSSPSIEREADLSGYDSATLTFDYRTSGNWESGDNVRIYLSNNGGSSWTLQDTISNDQASNTYSTVLAASYLTNNFRIRFVEGANQSSEIFHIDNVQINACATAPLHHIQITHDGTALTCQPESITVTACANAACTAPHYPNNVSVTLTPTGWVSGDTKLITSGSAVYELRNPTAGAVTLSASAVSPATTTLPSPSVSCVNSSVAGSTSCELTFYDSGFIYTIPTQTSCATSAAINIQAVRLDATTQTCVPAFQNVDRNLKVWASYNNPAPAAIIGTPAVTMINDKGTYTLPSTEPASTNVTMSFAASAEDTFTIAYPDAGRLILNTKYEGSAANSDTGLTMSGNSTFVVKPAKFYVYSDDVNSACASNDASCSAFKSASTPFNLKIRAACADNSKTPNFVLNDIAVGHTNTAPAVAQGSLGVTSFNMIAGDQGEHIINNQTVSEVGVFTFNASLPATTNYFGETSIGTSLLNTSSYVGRFYPHHFDNTVGQGCGTFTYSGQPFSVAVTAMNNLAPAPAATQNYTGVFAFNTTLSNAAITPIINFNGTNIIPAASFTNGTASKLDVAYTFAAKDTIPETITLRANDADTGSAVGVTEGSTEIRSGRMRLENVYGPELSPLIMPVRVEYYSDNTLAANTSDDGFITNPDDSCTTYDATLGTLTNYTGNLSTGETTVTGATSVTAGIANISFSAPGAGNEGSVILHAKNLSSWLTYNWNIDCDNADADNNIFTGVDAGLCGPYGTASFGLYRGDDRVIYWREVF